VKAKRGKEMLLTSKVNVGMGHHQMGIGTQLTLETFRKLLEA
jgi:hypothetical protein